MGLPRAGVRGRPSPVHRPGHPARAQTSQGLATRSWPTRLQGARMRRIAPASCTVTAPARGRSGRPAPGAATARQSRRQGPTDRSRRRAAACGRPPAAQATPPELRPRGTASSFAASRRSTQTASATEPERKAAPRRFPSRSSRGMGASRRRSPGWSNILVHLLSHPSSPVMDRIWLQGGAPPHCTLHDPTWPAVHPARRGRMALRMLSLRGSEDACAARALC